MTRNFPVEKEIRCLAQECKYIILMQHLKAPHYNKLSHHRALVIEALLMKSFRKVGGNQMRGDEESLGKSSRPLISRFPAETTRAPSGSSNAAQPPLRGGLRP